MTPEQANSALYFFSTGAQSIAAIVGLSAAMAIFRFDSITKAIDAIQQEIIKINVGLDNVSGIRLKGDTIVKYYNSDTAGKVSILRDYADGDMDGFTSKFRDLDTLEESCSALKKAVTWMTVVGVSVVIFGMLCTLLPGAAPSWAFSAELAFTTFTVLYAREVVKLVQVAFVVPRSR